MDYILPYDADSRYSDKDNIVFFFTDEQARRAEDVVQGVLNRHKRIIIGLDKTVGGDDTSYFDYYFETYPDADIEFMMAWTVLVRYHTYFRDHGKKFFYGGAILTIQGLNEILDYNVSRVILGGDMFFDIEAISKRLPAHIEIGIQPWENRYINKVNSAIVFPQELAYYADNCKVKFIFAPWDFPYVKYEIYNQGFWSGAISDIIPYTNSEDMVPLLLMNPYYTDIRVRCRHMCFDCNRCKQALEMGRAANAIRLGEEYEQEQEEADISE